MSIRSLLAPLGAARTYKHLAFLASGLALGTAWFVLLVTGWSLALGLAITLVLAIAVLIALAEACRWAGEGERRLANALLDAGVPAPARRSLPRRPVARVRAWLADPLAWREQAYLLLRFVAGLPMGTLVISLAGSSATLLVAPTWYWAADGDVRPLGFWNVDTLGEAFLAVPLGAAGLVLSAHLCLWFGAAWRRMARGLLGGQSAAAPATPEPSPAAAEPARLSGRGRAALLIHAGVSALLALALVIVWAATTRGYFWPIWPMLALGLAVGVHAAAQHGAAQPGARRALWIQAGVSAALGLFLVGIWLVSTPGGYFWPIWPILGLGIALGAHAVVAYVRRGERIEELTSTRAGAVDAQAAELRRIERDLHDGAQARLVALAMDLGMAEEKLDQEPEAARQLVGEARAEARRALVELRELVQGIHPPVLADRGLEAAVAALAARSPAAGDGERRGAGARGRRGRDGRLLHGGGGARQRREAQPGKPDRGPALTA
jgi:signal transduction histidine kinase